MDMDGAYGSGAGVRADLMRIAGMFVKFRDDSIMRELCRLAIKCTQEGLITRREDKD